MLPEQDILLEKLHREYFRKLTLYAMSVLKDQSRSQEVVQDTFHAAAMHINKLIVHKNPGGWLMETVKNKIRENQRETRRYLHRFLSLDTDVLAELIPSNENIEEDYGSDNRSTLDIIAQSLSQEEYKLLKRLVIDKASHLEVAQEFGITVYASQKRLERIRQKLYTVFPERKKYKK